MAEPERRTFFIVQYKSMTQWKMWNLWDTLDDARKMVGLLSQYETRIVQVDEIRTVVE